MITNIFTCVGLGLEVKKEESAGGRSKAEHRALGILVAADVWTRRQGHVLRYQEPCRDLTQLGTWSTERLRLKRATCLDRHLLLSSKDS